MKQSILIYTITAFIIISCNNNKKNSEEKKSSQKNITKKTEMNNQNYTLTIVVDSKPIQAFNAITNFRAWWSEDIEGNSDKLNEEFFYHYKDVHMCKIKLIESVSNRKLVYKVVDNQFSFTKDKTEWINTKLIFEISKEGNKTAIKFTHEGLTPIDECYEICEDAWSNYIQNSLNNLITTGKGQPNPKVVGGFNEEIIEKWKLK